MRKFINEFKEFINRGNVMDMAVGVIIGGAFTSIVTALTNNIINPLISVVAGGGAGEISGLVVPGTDIDFGAFISACINFLIVAFVVFCLVKALNKAKDLSEKLTGAEGLRKIIVRARVQPVYPVGHGVPGCQQQHRQGAAPGAQCLQHRQPVHFRHHDVQHRRVVGCRVQIGQRLRAVRYAVHGVARRR